MNITFTSIFTQDKINKKIEFTTPVIISKENNFTIYEFMEPDNVILNRIEISSFFINIFAGPNSINLALNKKIMLNFKTAKGAINLESKMYKIDILDNIIKFEYNLYNNKGLLGNYKITLKIQ